MRLGQPGGGTTTGCTSSNDLLNLAYTYGAQGYNNGNVTGETILPLNVTPSFTFDACNRLFSAAEGSAWSQSYKYDVDGNPNASYGNRYVSANSGVPLAQFTPSSNAAFSSDNRLKSSFNNSAYDDSGNLQTIGAYSYTYDAESRQTSVSIGNPVNTTTTYSYDGEGRRVQKVTAAGSTIYVYDATGQLAAEYTSTSPAETPGPSTLPPIRWAAPGWWPRRPYGDIAP